MSNPDNGTNDRLPPHDDISEAGALACVLLAESVEMFSQLNREMLYDERHREIFAALQCLNIDGKPLNVVSLAAWLTKKGRIQDAGGLEYVSALPDKTPSAANFPTYLESLKDCQTRRAIIGDISRLQDHAYDRAVDRSNLLNAAGRLAQTVAEQRTSELSISEELNRRRFNPDIEPPPLRTLYTLGGETIGTPGNLCSIAAMIKSGKSAAIGAMVAAALEPNPGADLLHFKANNPLNHAVILLDTEQSPDDFWFGVARAVRRAGLAKPPPWLLSYCLTGLGHAKARLALHEAIRRAGDQADSILAIFLDGVADFVCDVNDQKECNPFVAELHDIAIKQDCLIVPVIHFNPGSEKMKGGGKTRGHLGSQLERKAESNLTLEKDQRETVSIYSTKNRRADIPKSRGLMFAWNADKGMHRTVQPGQSAADKEEQDEAKREARDVFADHPSMRYTDLWQTIGKRCNRGERTAKKKVALWQKLGVVRLDVAGLYVPVH